MAKTLMIPLFSVTNTRPSGEKRTVVGCVNPEKTTDSENLVGKVALSTMASVGLMRHANAVQIPTKIRTMVSTLLILPLSENIEVTLYSSMAFHQTWTAQTL